MSNSSGCYEHSHKFIQYTQIPKALQNIEIGDKREYYCLKVHQILSQKILLKVRNISLLMAGTFLTFN